jgi:hypothetical protein
LDVIFQTILSPGGESKFKSCFLHERNGHSFLAIEIIVLVRTDDEAIRQRTFRNICHLLDPFRDSVIVSYLLSILLTSLSSHEQVSLADIEAEIQKWLTDGSDYLFRYPFRFDAGGRRYYFCDTWLPSLSWSTWRTFLLGYQPLFALLLRHLSFFHKYEVMEPVVQLIWYLRSYFGQSPGALRLLLDGCSLTSDIKMQELPFLKGRFGGLAIPADLVTGKPTAYNQITTLVNGFVQSYNGFLDELAKLVQVDVKGYDLDHLMPHSFLTYGAIRKVLGAVAAESVLGHEDGYWAADRIESGLGNVFNSPIPLCRFENSNGKDCFGFTDKEWGKAVRWPGGLGDRTLLLDMPRNDAIRAFCPLIARLYLYTTGEFKFADFYAGTEKEFDFVPNATGDELRLLADEDLHEWLLNHVRNRVQIRSVHPRTKK